MERQIVLFDLDGTLANLEHRLHHIAHKPKRWREFFAACDQDATIEPIRMIFCSLASSGYEIWVVSGRSDECRQQTLDWLERNECRAHKLIMRKEGDFRDDDIVKREWILNGTIPKERVLCVFDDRKRVVDMWRAEGLQCLQVAAGDF